jgi:ABC-type lipoprotein export system ATPase subunit
LLEKNNRVVVVGSPGIGKTTLLSYIGNANADNLIKQETNNVREIGLSDALIPILMKELRRKRTEYRPLKP